MKRNRRALLALLCPLLCPFWACGPVPGRYERDFYPDFRALSAANVEGRDFSREILDRRASVTVFAVHGGDIEPGTDRLARRIAGADSNLYILSGWLGPDSGRLHLRSANFDDPAAVSLSKRSVFAVSVHAQAERGEWVCVGGANKEAGRAVSQALRGAGFRTEFPCARLPGSGATNIVNLPAAGGVQLELTPGLLKELAEDPEKAERFAGPVREAAAGAAAGGRK